MRDSAWLNLINRANFGAPNMQFEAAATLIGLREGLEALLVTGILLGMVRRFGQPRRAIVILAGAGTGLVVSIGFGLAVQRGLAGWYNGANRALAEVVTGLAALGILTYMILWMYRHTVQTIAGARSRVLRAAETGSWFLLGSLAFFVVFREGVEMVLFFAARASQTPWDTLAVSGALGFGLSTLAAYAIFRMSVRINLEKFFAVTGLLLILLGAGILVGTVGAAETVGEENHWSTRTPAAYDLTRGFPQEDQCTDASLDPCPANDVIPGNAAAAALHTLIGYEDHPSWAQVLAYLAFVGGFGGWYAMSLRRGRHLASAQHSNTP